MRDVHKELQLGIGHLFSMDMLLQTQIVLFLATVLAAIQPEQVSQCKDVDDVCQWCAIPGSMDDNSETTLWGIDAVLLGHDTETIVTRREMRESNFVDTRLHAHPVLLVDAIFVYDVLWVVVSQR